jgi:hypothetical protein
MKPAIPTLAIAAILAVALGSLMPSASAQDQKVGSPPMMGQTMPDHGQMPGMMGHQGQGMAGMSGHPSAKTGPNMSGQDAFGAIQEIVQILEADPKTDWSKIDLEALRQHLIDMNEVTLKANAAARPIDGGVEIAVTGSERTLVAIQRMVPAHAQEINGLRGWVAQTAPLPNGVLLTVTATDPKEAQHIRGLGFIGILVSGMHHQPHHLAMAKGEAIHSH